MATTMKTTRGAMSVTFVRTGERCYAVRAAVEGMPIVEMDPAPGYDALVPHDLQHFIVERALGIEGAIYGQLAVGGTAGTFHTICSAPPASFERPRESEIANQASSRRVSGQIVRDPSGQPMSAGTIGSITPETRHAGCRR